jgi:hypothetical protein
MTSPLRLLFELLGLTRADPLPLGCLTNDEIDEL